MAVGIDPKERKRQRAREAEDYDDIDNFDDLDEVDDDEDTEGRDSSSSKKTKLILVGVLVGAIILFIIMFGFSRRGNEEEPVVEEPATTEPAQDTSTTPEPETEDTGIYDEQGNLKVNDGTYIDPGAASYSDNKNETTDPKVYNSTDFIKDLNGQDVSAAYTVKSYDYVDDYVSYEKRRAIMDDGMELYWLEANYHNKKYRITIPFWRYKALDDTGICCVEIEVLNLEGGGKIISYMHVIDNPTDN